MGLDGGGRSVTWFKLDDSFHHHPKVLRAGNAATGLWVRSATWSANYLTDGEIPRDVVERIAGRGEIERTLEAALWLDAGDRFLIPDWAEYQPTASEVRERRARDAARKRRWRESRGEVTP